MATIYYEKDIDRAPLEGKTVAVVGYGTGGSAHARNLRDSGVNVVVGARPESAEARLAQEHGFAPVAPAEAAAQAQVIALLVSGTEQTEVYENEILPHLTENKALLFANGFAIRFGQITPPDNVDVIMIAPKSPGEAVRTAFEGGAGVPCLVATHRDFSGGALKIALAYGAAIGCGRAGILESTFAEEMDAALFASQAVLAGGVPELVRSAFEVLTEGGCQPEVAYCNILNELKYFTDAMQAGGLAGLYATVSAMTEYGGRTRGGRIIGESSREALRDILAEIQNGSFAREWLCECLVKQPVLKSLRERGREHPIETTGAKLRKNMR